MNKIRQFLKNISPFNNRTEMPKILYVIKVLLIFFVFKFGAELVGEAVVIGIHFACGLNPLEGEMFDMNTITIITYLGYSVLIGVVILLWKLFQKKSVKELGFTKNFASYFIGIAAGTGLLAACIIPVTLTGAIQYNGIFENIDIKMILMMIACYVLQGAMEEVLCRGVVQQLLMKKTSVPVAIGITAAVFVFPHISKMEGASPAIAVTAIVNLVLISIIFSLLTIRFKSIWAACGLHSVWNFILNSILGLNLSGNGEKITAVFDMRSVGSNVLNGGEYGIEASILTAVVLAAVVGICILDLRKTAKKTAEAQLAIS